MASKLPRLSLQDSVGSPLPSDVADIDGYSLSGTAAFSALCVAQMESLFGQLGGLHVAEIGGGYGSLANCLLETNEIHSYTMYDLTEPCLLQRKYLIAQGWSSRVRFPVLGDLGRSKYDLAIAWCSLSELNQSEQEFYAKNVLEVSDRGFLGWNWNDRDARTSDGLIGPALDRLQGMLPDKKIEVARFTDELLAVFTWGMS